MADLLLLSSTSARRDSFLQKAAVNKYDDLENQITSFEKIAVDVNKEKEDVPKKERVSARNEELQKAIFQKYDDIKEPSSNFMQTIQANIEPTSKYGIAKLGSSLSTSSKGSPRIRQTKASLLRKQLSLVSLVNVMSHRNLPGSVRSAHDAFKRQDIARNMETMHDLELQDINEITQDIMVKKMATKWSRNLKIDKKEKSHNQEHFGNSRHNINKESTSSLVDERSRKHSTMSKTSEFSHQSHHSRHHKKKKDEVIIPRWKVKSSKDVNVHRKAFRWRNKVRNQSLGLDLHEEYGESNEEDEKKISWGGMVFERRSVGRFVKAGQAKIFFSKAARKVLNVLHWMVVLSRSNEKIESTLKSFVDITKEMDGKTEREKMQQAAGLSFDPTFYKAVKDVQLSTEVKAILTLPAHSRDDEMISKALHGLMHQKAFAEYPLKLQHKLAKVVWYQRVPPRRVIVRQGHYPENFYFILSGTAIVKQITQDPQTGKPYMRVLSRIQKGQSFGELALLHQTKRTATVESQTEIQMLIINRTDFTRIFSMGKDSPEPEHVLFMKTEVPFLKHWPVEKVAEDPSKCIFHFFRAGSVVVSCSMKSTWIVIVKSGTCRILKKLKAVKPCKSIWKPKLLDLHVKLPRMGSMEPKSKINSGLDKRRRINVPYELAEVMADYKGRPKRSKSFDLTEEPKPVTTNKRHSVTFDLPGQKSKNRVKELVKLQDLSLSVPPPQPKTPAENKPGYSSSKVNFFGMTTKPNMRSESCQEWKRDDDYLDVFSNPNKDKDDSKKQMNCFAQLKRLLPRDTFGLEFVTFENEPPLDETSSVTLVSDGAELIMLDVNFFLKYSNEHVRRNVKETTKPFPCDDVLQSSLNNEINWNFYKNKSVKDFCAITNELKGFEVNV